MNATRPHLAPLAKLLILLVLLNGLACSLGHGQMLRAMFEPSGRQGSTLHAHHHDMGAMAGMQNMAGMDATPSLPDLPMPGMNSPFGDCLFAGSLPSLIVAFALIGWLLRFRPQRPRPPLALFCPSPRAILPNLNPRAP